MLCLMLTTSKQMVFLELKLNLLNVSAVMREFGDRDG